MYDRNKARRCAVSCGIAAGWVFWLPVVVGATLGTVYAGTLSYGTGGFGGLAVLGFLVGALLGCSSGYVLSRILLAQKYSLLSMVDLEEKTPRRIAVATTQKPDTRGVHQQEPKGTGIVAHETVSAKVSHDTLTPR
jgi:hypothetical protein